MSVFANVTDSYDPVLAADIDIVELDFPEYSENEAVDSNICLFLFCNRFC